MREHPDVRGVERHRVRLLPGRDPLRQCVRGQRPARGDHGAHGVDVGEPAVVAAWHSFLSPAPSATPTCFTEQQLNGQLVVVGGMSVWSLCEHHLLPMNLEVAVGYTPDGALVGLSKFGIAQRHAESSQRPQN